MKLAVVGSRSIIAKELVTEIISKAIESYASPNEGIVILSGGAKGVDSLSRDIAYEKGYDFILFKPYHMLDPTIEYTARFFFVRNKQIADNADVVAIVWDGVSNGTKHMIDYCIKHKKPYLLQEIKVI